MPAGFRFTEGGHVDGDQEEKQVPYENIRISYLPPSEGGENGGLYGLWGSGAFGLKSDVALNTRVIPVVLLHEGSFTDTEKHGKRPQEEEEERVSPPVSAGYASPRP